MILIRHALTLILGLAFVLAAAAAALPLLDSPEASRASAPLPLASAPNATPTPVLRAAPSGPPIDSAALDAAWQSWMAERNVTEGALVLLSPDGQLHRSALGRATSDIVPVASLSKTITGLCLDDILQEQDLSWYTRLGDIRDQMSAIRVTPQSWNEHITLAALATHTSGLSPDLTQGLMGSELHGALGLHRRTATEALREDNIQGRSGTYFYSNTNYAVLGVVIEALTGESYAQTCAARVLAPAGITDAVIEGRMGSMSSFAGWELSAESYARLAQHWFTAGRDAIDRPFERPMHDNYTIGYRIIGDGPSAIVTQAGRYCHSRPERSNGAFFVARGDGTVAMATWAGCVPRGEVPPFEALMR
ncbi:serine hydrolase domain-containing protein [Gymnodinialimonas sp. 2305UL16-5]|uniref:serine hydrolase domain-containing protein n=1 Tax=Gymnodinialimonas mytili TaxID=3126503 RepID=UPI0030B27581